MLTEGEARFRLMFERSADAILLLDTSKNKFIEYNQAALDMLRCTREELRDLHPSELSPPTQPDGRPSFDAANERIATAVRQGSNRFEWVHKSPHREDFPVEVLLTPITAGDTPTLLVVWRDIAERKHAEEALRAAQKRESLGVLAGGVAHDFNNLLTAISARLALARRTLEPGHEGHAHLDAMGTAVAQAAALCRQMLAYSGQGALVVEPVDLNRTVEETVELLRASTPRGVRLELSLAEGRTPIEANRVELMQAVMNLVTNAVEASPPRGTVRVRTSTLQVDDALLRRDFPAQSLAPGTYLALTVTDEGPGMSPEVQAKIFDPFFSTKSAGRGLGLSAVSGIVRSHGGALKVRSAEREGSSFTLAFHRSATPVPSSRAPAKRPAARAHGQVLVVDDHAAVRTSTRRLLESFGYSTLEAADGPGAVETYKQHPGEIRWVLMDLTMPGMDGHEAFVAIRELDPKAVVVLSSGWAESELTERFRADPPAAFLSKPYRESDLEEVLRNLELLDA